MIGDRLPAPLSFLHLNRLVRLETPLNEAALQVARLSGREAVSETFRFEVECVSSAGGVSLDALLGEEVCVRLLLADGGLRSWHGHVTAALYLGTDGGLAGYRLVVEPWLAFLGQRRNCQVFQDKAVPAILEALFADYPEANWRIESDQPFKTRALCVQYRETDLHFVRRLMAEEGLSFRFEHEQDDSTGEAGQTRLARHRLVIFDRETELPPARQPVVRFHRADAPEYDDSITDLVESREARINALTLSSWDETQVRAVAAEAVSAQDNGQLPPMQHFEGAALRAFEEGSEAELRSALQLAAEEGRYREFDGRGAVRAMAEGTVFSLAGHQGFVGEAAEFVVYSVEHRAANNLGAEAARLLAMADIEKGSYRNRVRLRHKHAARVPEQVPKPVAYLQSALVTGRAGAGLTTDRDHRVRIQFPWQRGATPNPGGLRDTGPAGAPGNAPGDDRSGCWVRVAEWLAGPNWGSQFLPRVGTEVLVDFIDGDIDRPLIVGQLYNGRDLPPFAAGVDAGVNHPGVLSGWTSHNLGSGYNQWLVDDAPGQLRTRLACSYGDSQLGLGHLIDQHPACPRRGAWRGSGFELRTDGWLALRAAEGILISATAMPEARGTQMDVTQAVGQLRAAERTASALSDAAEAQGAAPLAANDAQVRFIDLIDSSRDGRYSGDVGGQPARKALPGSRDPGEPTERFAAPMVLAEAPDDIGVSSPATALLFAGGSLHATAQQDLHLAAAQTIGAAVGEGASWFTRAGGIRIVAAAGSHTVEAHADAMEILADSSVKVTSSKDELHILASKEIVLRAGESSLTIKGGDISFACPGTFSVKGAGNAFEGPESRAAEPAVLPSGVVRLSEAPGAMLSAHSLTLEFDERVQDWLPWPFGESSSLRNGRELLATLARSGSDRMSSTFISSTEQHDLAIWLASDATWCVEEAVEAPFDEPHELSPIELEAGS